MDIPSEDNPWTLLGDDYQVGRLLGRGGMGEVRLFCDRFTEQQYAVKINHVPGAGARRQFLEELLTWIDLPDHPQLVACRFFRSIGADILIFSDYVAGGSVSDRLRDGGLRESQQVLDVAIQAARGLSVLHGLGLVHQDIKPSNLLLTEGGLVKISDFGLARARAAQDYAAEDYQPGRTTARGTPQYWSPEQAAGKPLDIRSDIWSLGLAVLEMVAGAATWLDGEFAAGILERMPKRLPPERLTLLSALADALRGCFRESPADRWSSPAELEVRLRTAYRQVTGEDYTRAEAIAPSPEGWTFRDQDFRRSGDSQWADPGYLLSMAYHEAGMDTSGIDARPVPPVGSLRARAVADMGSFAEAQARPRESHRRR